MFNNNTETEKEMNGKHSDRMPDSLVSKVGTNINDSVAHDGTGASYKENVGVIMALKWFTLKLTTTVVMIMSTTMTTAALMMTSVYDRNA